MILRRVIEHVKHQNWTAIVLDFVIVVMGVFIGLQVSNWNSGRAEQQQIRAYMLALKEDLVSDREMLSVVTRQINERIERAGLALDYSRGRAFEDFNNLDLLILIPSSVYRPYAWNRTTFAQLRSTGGVPKIADARLRAMVANYEAMTEHLDLDFESDSQGYNILIEISYGVIDRNYPELIDLTDLEFDTLREARATEAYQKARALNLQVIAREDQEIREMINSLYILRGYLYPRVNREIPELIELGAEIIEQIEHQYGD